MPIEDQDQPGARAFLLAVITAPDFFPGEVDCLEGLLEAGLEKLHLRKPGASEAEMESLLRQIAPRWHSRLVLHPLVRNTGGARRTERARSAESIGNSGRAESAGSIGRTESIGNTVRAETVGRVRSTENTGRAGGNRELYELAVRHWIPQIHCPWRQPTGGQEPPDATRSDRGKPLAVSASLHSWDELKEIEGTGLTYVFMSPVFDSISKPGYAATPGLWQQPDGPYPCKVIGLGGVDNDTIGGLIRGGWEGAAVLGWIWEQPRAAVQRYQQLKKIISH